MIASNRYRSHTCAVLRPEHIGQPVKLAGWVHRKRDHGSLLFIDLRDHYGITQCVFTPNSAAFAAAESVRLESVISVSGNVIERTPENVNPALPTGGIEVKVDGSRSAVDRRAAAVPGRGHAGHSRRAAPALPVPRPAAREDPRQHHPALEGDCQHPAPDAGAGLSRVPDADPDVELAGRRARLPGAQPDSRGEVLRAAAGAAAVQAAPDGGRLRSLLPDRPLLSRRRRPCRPIAGRVLPARRRAVLRDAGRRVRRDRARARGRVPGVLRLHGHAAAVSPHRVRRCDGDVRERQAGPAQSRSRRRT